jgi:hypothetical protein
MIAFLLDLADGSWDYYFAVKIRKGNLIVIWLFLGI